MTLFTAMKSWLRRLLGKPEEKTVHPVKTKKKLSRADKKQIEAAIARANRTDKKGKSAQDSIPYERMWPDGICRVSDSHYTKTIQFQDINYQLSQNEDKTAIFEGWCDFLNYFDSSIHFQLSFLNLAASEETFANSISIPPQGDAFDSIREEYTTMLQNQLARGNNGLIKTKFPTPEPVNIPALLGCGSWRSVIWIPCRPCWSAPTMFPVMTLPDNSPR